jgi:hypothetical protein
MNAPISNPADCEVRGVILYLQAVNILPIHTYTQCVSRDLRNNMF